MAYQAQKKRNLYHPGTAKPYPLSRSKVELFVQCPRCFYLELRRGIKRPPTYPFTLNNAVDELLKKEFDQYRAIQQPHPIMEAHDLNMVPFHHPQLDKWRHNFTGIRHYATDWSFDLFGAVDDIWVTPDDTLTVVDYKATSREITHPNSLVYPAYKRQLGFYRWLLEQQGFPVSPKGYLLYCNGERTATTFEGRLDFAVYLIPVATDTRWITPTLQAMHSLLQAPDPPAAHQDCDYCAYTAARSAAEE